MDESGKVVLFSFQRREKGVDDVTDQGTILRDVPHGPQLHQQRLGQHHVPRRPGPRDHRRRHQVGTNVSGFQPGNRVGVGGIAASCLDCDRCHRLEENYCDKVTFTYNSISSDGSITYTTASPQTSARSRPSLALA
ncbi:hypothetical protein QYE76_019157 [Lolium multiflorum]|uniref:Alcohol dehydrogenase-like N-terminal domain-containing protein n=1 Tax=Lolium multiflorum TaxID=4521 RepID=A0AAD8VQQ6_LOLMU|nr:hypothetical protein QYE76_019157 [Lolium multiflorum]